MQDVEALTIRACGPDEAGRLAATAAHLFTQAFGPTHPEPELGAYLAREFAPSRLAAELAGPGRRALVVESGGRWIGYAYLRESAEVGIAACRGSARWRSCGSTSTPGGTGAASPRR
jgi:hypothetical protein